MQEQGSEPSVQAALQDVPHVRPAPSGHMLEPRGDVRSEPTRIQVGCSA
jgi:hypothetical protein